MRGGLMRLFTQGQHQNILKEFPDDISAAEQYSVIAERKISRQCVQYWRKIFIENKGNLSGTDRRLKEGRVLLKPQPDDDFGKQDFVQASADMILVIPDLHAPYHHPDAARFLKTVRDTFSPDLVVSLGDELDYHAMSFHDSDPNLASAGTELEAARVFMQSLHELFPEVLVCHSNHGSMAYRRAKAHGIPVQLIKKYRDIIFPQHGAPCWSWASSWRIGTPLGDVLFKHQAANILTDAAHNACNLVVGHNHGNFSIEYSASSSHIYYGVYSGCLIDKDSMAFAYGKHSMRKPIIGCTVIMNGRPVLLPMILNDSGRWIGRL